MLLPSAMRRDQDSLPPFDPERRLPRPDEIKAKEAREAAAAQKPSVMKQTNFPLPGTMTPKDGEMMERDRGPAPPAKAQAEPIINITCNLLGGGLRPHLEVFMEELLKTKEALAVLDGLVKKRVNEEVQAVLNAPIIGMTMEYCEETAASILLETIEAIKADTSKIEL